MSDATRPAPVSQAQVAPLVQTNEAAERFHLKARAFMEKVREHGIAYVDTGRGFLFTEAALVQLQEAMTNYQLSPKKLKALREKQAKSAESMRAAYEALEAARKTRNNPGNVYFIKHCDLVKIGFAKDVQARLTTLQTGAPEALVLLRSIPATERRERDLHQRFAAYRVRGEWFRHEGELAWFIKHGNI